MGFTVSTGNTVSVVAKSCAQGYYSFAHEIGHNIGLYHNREIGHINPIYTFAQGHLIKQGSHSTGFRTILAYSAANHRTRVNYYSNPDVIHPVTGTPCGVANSENNAAFLMQERFKLAALGDESITCTVTTPSPPPTTPSPPPSACNGGSNAWSCCTSSNRCGLGGGDCDSNSHCQSGLVCGNNNCRNFHPGAQSSADCCERACDGGSSTWSCCNSNNRCGLGGGDCDSNSHCQSGLVCGYNNCRKFHPGAQAAADC